MTIVFQMFCFADILWKVKKDKYGRDAEHVISEFRHRLAADLAYVK